MEPKAGTNDSGTPASWIERYAAKANAKREAKESHQQKHCVKCGAEVKSPLLFENGNGPNCLKCNRGY